MMTDPTAAQADLRPVMADLLALGMQGAGPYLQRAVRQMHIAFHTSPYGRSAPHLTIMPDGRVDKVSGFESVVAGYGDDVLVCEVLGHPGDEANAAQLTALRALAQQMLQITQGQMQFIGQTDLLVRSIEPVASHQDVPMGPSNVHNLFDVLGTPPDRRAPLRAGELFNATAPASADPSRLKGYSINFPGMREVFRLVAVPTHDPFKPEPTDAAAYDLATLRKSDMAAGMPDFRAHFLIKHDGTLVPGRDLAQLGSSWPGMAEGSIQLAVAGNGKAPTREQRRVLFDIAEMARRHYGPRPLQGFERGVAFVKELWGIDPLGNMDPNLANPRVIEAEAPAAKGQRLQAG